MIRLRLVSVAAISALLVVSSVFCGSARGDAEDFFCGTPPIFGPHIPWGVGPDNPIYNSTIPLANGIFSSSPVLTPIAGNSLSTSDIAVLSQAFGGPVSVASGITPSLTTVQLGNSATGPVNVPAVNLVGTPTGPGYSVVGLTHVFNAPTNLSQASVGMDVFDPPNWYGFFDFVDYLQNHWRIYEFPVDVDQLGYANDLINVAQPLPAGWAQSGDPAFDWNAVSSVSFDIALPAVQNGGPVTIPLIDAGVSVPEPATVGLLACAGVGLLARRRSARK